MVNETKIDKDKNISSSPKNGTENQNSKAKLPVYEKIKIVNWNIGGAKYLQEIKGKREKTKARIQNDLIELIHAFKPDIITLQEIVQYKLPDKKGEPENKIIDIIDINAINEEIQTRYKKEWIEEDIKYEYFPFILVDSEKQSSEAKWERVKIIENEGDKIQNWDDNTYFAQGNAFMCRKNLPHFRVWDLSKIEDQSKKLEDKNAIEQVNLETGLYFGDRNTEPRAALVAHFIVNPKKNVKDKKTESYLPYDIFVINVHLTTLMGEREGIPEIDMKASEIRQYQLEIIFDGIISRYNNWRRMGYQIRQKERNPGQWETYKRHDPLWIIAGDFNFTPESEEYRKIVGMNFKDVIPNKKNGSKAKGVGNRPTLTLDYIFAGPKFIALDPIIIDNEINANSVHDHYKSSDHKPMDASIPIVIRPIIKKY